MNERPTTEIVTPFGGQKVVIKDWLIGREREYINAPMLGAVQIQPKIVGKNTSMDMGNMDMGSIVTESNHREITTYVVSIDGKTENILETVLEMHEDDVDAINAVITSKKKPVAQPEATA